MVDEAAGESGAAFSRDRGTKMSADLVLRNGGFTTLDRSNPTATAVAITAGVFTAVGRDREVIQSAGPHTRNIDLAGPRVVSGPTHNHLAIIPGRLKSHQEARPAAA